MNLVSRVHVRIVAAQAQAFMTPVAARPQLNDFWDYHCTRASIEFYNRAPDAVFKTLVG